MSWYKVTFSHEDIAAFKGMKLQDAFEKLFVSYGGPKGVGMFFDPTVGIHDYYFSPASAEFAAVLIAGYKGVPCDAPTRSAVRILVSHAGAQDIPFAPEP